MQSRRGSDFLLKVFIERYALFTRRGEEPQASRQPAIRAAVIRSNFERKQSKHSSRVDRVVWGRQAALGPTV